MYEDAIKTSGNADRIELRELTELLEEALVAEPALAGVMTGGRSAPACGRSAVRGDPDQAARAAADQPGRGVETQAEIRRRSGPKTTSPASRSVRSSSSARTGRRLVMRKSSVGMPIAAARAAVARTASRSSS